MLAATRRQRPDSSELTAMPSLSFAVSGTCQESCVCPPVVVRRGLFGLESGLEHSVELIESDGDVGGDPAPTTGFE